MIDRIKQIMEYYLLTPAAFAEQIGINRSNLTHLFSGRNQPSLELAKKILHCFPEIKTEWLIMGVGEMMRSNEEKELNIKIQNEQKQINEQNGNLDLFTSSEPPKIGHRNYNAQESDVASEKKINTQIFDSKRDIEKQVSVPVDTPIEKESPLSHPTSTSLNKIIFFYSDKSFEVFNPK